MPKLGEPRRYFHAGGTPFMSPRVHALSLDVSRLRSDLVEAAGREREAKALADSRLARIADLEQQIRRQDAEIARMRAEWIPRRVHEACIRIDGVAVREYAR